MQVWDYQLPVETTNNSEEEEEDLEDDENDCALVRVCSLTRVAKTGSRATCLASCTFLCTWYMFCVLFGLLPF